MPKDSALIEQDRCCGGIGRKKEEVPLGQADHHAVAAHLEAQSQQCYSVSGHFQNRINHTLNMGVVAGEDTTKERRLHVPLFRDVIDRAHVLRQARASKAETRAEVAGRNIEVFVLAEDTHDGVTVDAQRLAQAMASVAVR